MPFWRKSSGEMWFENCNYYYYYYFIDFNFNLTAFLPTLINYYLLMIIVPWVVMDDGVVVVVVNLDTHTILHSY